MLTPWIRSYYQVRIRPHYSTVVNRSQYRPDKLAKRELDAGNTPSTSGMFDGKRNEINVGDIPTELIFLREGRLSRTEIDKLHDVVKQRAIAENAQNEIALADAMSKASNDKLSGIIDSIASCGEKS